MAISSATGGAFGQATAQLAVQQAQRAADRAESAARRLRADATTAQHSADREQERARELQVRSSQAESEVGSARQRVSSLTAADRLQSDFGSLRENIADALVGLDQPAPASAPVLNAEGQTTGTLVSVTA